MKVTIRQVRLSHLVNDDGPSDDAVDARGVEADGLVEDDHVGLAATD